MEQNNLFEGKIQMEKKKILVLAHYFYADVASTGQILTELFENLQNTNFIF